MPENLAGTRNIMEFIVKEVSSNTYVNIMSQYRPCGRAMNMRELNRVVGPEEFRQALKEATVVGITRIDGRRLNF
jgi:putative pyruvate formate lyase activating enzyme